MDETLARGPVPCERSVTRGMARDRPSPYAEGEAASTTVARGPVPRDRSMARDRPSPYGEGAAFFTVARGPSEVSIRASERVPPAIAAWRGTGPRPTVKGRRFFPERGGQAPAISHPLRKTLAAQRPRMFAAQTGAWRGTGPRPTVKGRRFFPERGGQAPAIAAWRGKPARMRVWHPRALALR